MRFLLDENQSPLLVGFLAALGYESVHVRGRGLAGASDEALLDLAAGEGLVVVSGDTDFGELLARSTASVPSVILLRRQSGRRAEHVAALLAANLEAVRDDLDAGAIVVFDEDRIRVRNLPLRPR